MPPCNASPLILSNTRLHFELTFVKSVKLNTSAELQRVTLFNRYLYWACSGNSFCGSAEGSRCSTDAVLPFPELCASHVCNLPARDRRKLRAGRAVTARLWLYFLRGCCTSLRSDRQLPWACAGANAWKQVTAIYRATRAFANCSSCCLAFHVVL